MVLANIGLLGFWLVHSAPGFFSLLCSIPENIHLSREPRVPELYKKCRPWLRKAPSTIRVGQVLAPRVEALPGQSKL